jgi:hypothetical protein
MLPGPPDTSNAPQNTAFPPWDPRSDPTFEPPKPPEPRAASELPSLTNDIHPLFSRDKFPANVDYDWVFLEPAKLASQILSTRQATHWLLALFTNCKHKSTCEGNEFERHPYRSNVGINELQDCHRDFVQHWLNKIAKSVNFEVGGYDEEGPSALAWTWHMVDADDEPAPDFSLGESEIHISGELYCELLLGKNLKAGEILRRRFSMASILLHELGHALWYAVTERDGDDDTFDDATTAEAGSSFEAHLFGLMPYLDTQLESRLEWHSQCGVRYPRFCTSAERNYVESLFADRYVESLFTDHFWDSNCLYGGDLGIVAPYVREMASHGGWKPQVIPTSIWELCNSSQSMEERFVKEVYMG